MDLKVQALFLHDRLIAGALALDDRRTLEREVERLQKVRQWDFQWAHVGAYETIVSHQLGQVPELDIALVERSLTEGSLVTLTQDFNVRRVSADEGAFRSKVDVDRSIALEGRFSTSHLIGTTGQHEIYGRKRFTMLAYVEHVALDVPKPTIRLRPTFIGWRLGPSIPGLPNLVDDRSEVHPEEIDQFAAMRGRRVTKPDLTAVASMSEDAVKHAFADIIGEPFVPKDWAGETSDLATTRLSIDGTPTSAAFAFKGPGAKGKLHIADMGKRGDQAIRLAQEPVDILIVQHHNQIVPAVRHLMSAIARSSGKQYMVIDGATTAILLRSYNKLLS